MQENGKHVKSGSSFIAGKIISFKATPKEGFSIDHWEINEKSRYEAQNEIAVKIEEDTNVIACFKAKPKTYRLTYSCNEKEGTLIVQENGKNIESGTSLIAGKIISFKASPKSGFSIDHWKINEKPRYEAQEEISLKIEKDTNVVACFKAKPKTYRMTYSCNEKEGTLIVQENGKHVESGTFIEEGARLVFTATPKEGFDISNWLLNGKQVNGLNSTYELEIVEDSHINVNFSKKIKGEIIVEKIVIGKNEYLNNADSNKKTLNLLENEKEEILILENTFNIKVYVEKPDAIEAKLIINEDTTEELKEDSGSFEKKDIAITEDFKTFKISLSKDGYKEKAYIFKAKKKVAIATSIPENLRIKKIFVNTIERIPLECIEADDNGIDYNIEFSADKVGSFCVWILGENEEAEFKEKNSPFDSTKADTKDYIVLSPIPDKNQTKTFVIVFTYKGEEIEYNLNVHVKGE